MISLIQRSRRGVSCRERISLGRGNAVYPVQRTYGTRTDAGRNADSLCSGSPVLTGTWVKNGVNDLKRVSTVGTRVSNCPASLYTDSLICYRVGTTKKGLQRMADNKNNTADSFLLHGRVTQDPGGTGSTAALPWSACLSRPFLLAWRSSDMAGSTRRQQSWFRPFRIKEFVVTR
jgi:hypothetical protein